MARRVSACDRGANGLSRERCAHTEAELHGIKDVLVEQNDGRRERDPGSARLSAIHPRFRGGASMVFSHVRNVDGRVKAGLRRRRLLGGRVVSREDGLLGALAGLHLNLARDSFLFGHCEGVVRRM